MEADFSGYATKAGLKCTDGRTIMPGAFGHQDKAKVPLVWQHGHGDPENVLGHAILENRDDGVYCYGFFNESAKAVHAKGLLQHDDITMLSIWANELVERAGRVLHGAIREVSLVLSGANPGALIENVTIRHSDGDEDVVEGEAIIYTGLELEHADMGDDGADDEDGETIQDIYDSMNQKQKDVLHFMLGEALGDTTEGGEAQQSNLDHGNNQEGTDMGKHNVFENGGEETGPVISHADISGIVADATKGGSLKEAVEGYALAHGITDIDLLFPEAQTIGTTPEFFARRMEWVNTVLNGARKSPFSRIKTMSADLTFDDARAKGYIKGNMKKEEFFGLARRITTPQTIYKKQKLDRDDIIDITDFDVVVWMKGEMRVMLDEELARAVLLGDGREVDDEDKINETNIRPIAYDDEMYTTVINVNLDDASSSVQEIVDAVVMARASYRGTGTPTLYTTENIIARFLLLKDTLGRRLYTSLDQLATELRVASVVPVEVMEDYEDIVGVIVNMSDYVLGADRGGQVTMFDDFDIDYNQYKYLIETRVSGALIKLKSAMVIKRVAGGAALVVPAAPEQEDDEVTITNTTGVVYKVSAFEGTVTYNAIQVAVGTTVTATYPVVIGDGASVTIEATPASGSYYFATSDDDEWFFNYEA